jgi:radical SAM protein (TIGR01212 family)
VIKEIDRTYPWGTKERYNDFRPVFQARFPGKKIQKLSVNAAFTCPNRDGSKGRGGCTYCNNASFTPDFSGGDNSVTNQLEKGVRFFAGKYPEMKYLAFFQSFSNTYAPLFHLKALYEEALRFPGVEGLVISTRPDCLSPEIMDYLSQLSERCFLMLELGVESHLDETLHRLNRGHTFHDAAHAIRESAARGIAVTAHMMLGLPGEDRKTWMEQADTISGLPVNNLKLHQLQIHRHTAMARQYATSPESFRLFTEEEYAQTVVDYLERLNPLITVERFTSQAPPGLLIAPAWGVKNYVFTARVKRLLEERDTWQGREYKES